MLFVVKETIYKSHICKNCFLYLSYLFAFLHSMQQTTKSTTSRRHAADMLQKAICNGARGSHQY